MPYSGHYGISVSGMRDDASSICCVKRRFCKSLEVAPICLRFDYLCGNVCISEIYFAERSEVYGKVFGCDCYCNDWILCFPNGKIFSAGSTNDLLLWKYFISTNKQIKRILVLRILFWLFRQTVRVDQFIIICNKNCFCIF